MRYFVGAALASLILLTAHSASAEVLPEDTGKCATGLIMAHAAHEELGHDLVYLSVGGKPWRPWVLRGVRESCPVPVRLALGM